MTTTSRDELKKTAEILVSNARSVRERGIRFAYLKQAADHYRSAGLPAMASWCYRMMG